MFDYTKAAFTKVINDFKRLFFTFSVVMQSVYIAYLIYAIIIKSGHIAINAALLVVSLAYLIIYIVTLRGGKTAKEVNKVAKRSAKWFKIVSKAITLGIAVYGIYQTANGVNPLSILLVALMIIGWIIQVLLEVVLYFLENKVDYIITGLKQDWEESSGLGRVAGNLVFNKVLGWELEEEPNETKKSALLTALVSEARAERKRLREQRKMDRIAQRKKRWEERKNRRKKTTDEPNGETVTSDGEVTDSQPSDDKKKKRK